MNEVTKFFADAFRHMGGNRGVPAIEVRFYPYAGLRHTIRLRSGRVYVRLSDICKDSPPEVLRALAWILVARLLGKRVPTIHDRVYRDYSLTPSVMRSSDLARRGRGRKMISTAQGEVYDLDRMFAKLNRRYFDGAITKADDHVVTASHEEHSRSSRPYLRQHHDQQDSGFERHSGVVCRVHPLSRDAAHQAPGTFDQRAALLSHVRISAGRAQISILRAVAEMARASRTAAPRSTRPRGVTPGTIRG